MGRKSRMKKESKKMKNSLNKHQKELTTDFEMMDRSSESLKRLLKSKGKKEVAMEKVKWELLDVNVEVIEHSQREARDLIKNVRFKNQEAYEQYVIFHSIRNLEEVFPRMDDFIKKCADEGIELPAEALFHELYLVACTVNVFLHGTVPEEKKAG